MFGQFNFPGLIRLAMVVSGVFVGSVALPIPLHAQTREEGSAAEEVVVVTGSRIRRIEQEGPSPVVSITAEDMNNRGYQTVLEALNDLSQNSGGGFDQQNTFGFVPSASGLDLRGFGSGRALVLIDGRRVPVFPLAENGSNNFVDLSSIPAVAIERIEVLTDGASAIYGSDAVSGVINVILKKRADDALSLRRSDTSDGGGAQDRYQFSTGLEGENGSTAGLFLEYYKQHILNFTDRSYSRSDVFGNLGAFSSLGNPGTLTNPFVVGVNVPAVNCDASNGSPGVIGGVCRFNRAAYRELVPEMERYSLTGKYDRPISDNVAAFGRITYLNSTVRTQLEPMGLDMAGDLGIVLAADAPNNPTNPAVDTAGDYAGQNTVGGFRRRLAEFGPRTAKIDNDTLSALFGLRGTFGSGFGWESGVSYSEQRVSERDGGFARQDGVFNLLCGPAGPDADGICNTGTLNLFETIPQDVIDQLRIEPRTDGISSIATVDFSVNGDLFDMPSGKAKFAVTTEFNRQNFSVTHDSDTLNGNVIALGGSSGGGSRKYYAAGVEVELPVFSNFTVNVAGRYDDYNDDSDVGGAFSPRLGLEYRPMKSLLLRAAAGKSFRAPDLQRLFGAELAAFTDLIDTPTCVGLGGEKGVSQNLPPVNGEPAFDVCTDLVQAVDITEGANRNLTEETGQHFSGGVVWEALAGLTVSVDLFYIELNNIVNTPDLQTILDKNAATGQFADAITHLPSSASVINPGGLNLVSAQARNLSLQRTRGVDFNADYRLPIGEAGNLTFGVGGTYIDQLEIRELSGEPLVDVLKDGTLAEEARFKGNAKASWTRGPISTAAYLNYIGPFTSFFPDVQKTVGSWTTLNLSGAYEFAWNGQLQIGVNNVFDRDPPLYSANGSASQPFYNQFFHDPYGATWWANYTQKF